MAYAFSDDIKIINLGWSSRSVTTSVVGHSLATAGLLVVYQVVALTRFLLLLINLVKTVADIHRLAAQAMLTSFLGTTYRKPHMVNPLITWLMTLRTSILSGLWPQNLPITVPDRLQWTIYRKPYVVSPVVMWTMTSRDCGSCDFGPIRPIFVLMLISSGCRDFRPITINDINRR